MSIPVSPSWSYSSRFWGSDSTWEGHRKIRSNESVQVNDTNGKREATNTHVEQSTKTASGTRGAGAHVYPISCCLLPLTGGNRIVRTPLNRYLEMAAIPVYLLLSTLLGMITWCLVYYRAPKFNTRCLCRHGCHCLLGGLQSIYSVIECIAWFVVAPKTVCSTRGSRSSTGRWPNTPRCRTSLL